MKRSVMNPTALFASASVICLLTATTVAFPDHKGPNDREHDGFLFQRHLASKGVEPPESPPAGPTVSPPTPPPPTPADVASIQPTTSETPSHMPSHPPSNMPSNVISSTPTLMPVPPTGAPQTATPTPRSACGISMNEILQGLTDAPIHMNDMQAALATFGTLDNERRLQDYEHDDNDRDLAWPLLILGVSALVSGLSVASDSVTVGSALYGLFDGSEGETEPDVEALFHLVFSGLADISDGLEDIAKALNDGFAQLTGIVELNFAQEEMDDLLFQTLGPLKTHFTAYVTPNQSLEQRKVYQDIFRNQCREDRNPFQIVKNLYAHSCGDCDLFADITFPANNMMEGFVQYAITAPSLDTTEKRIRWFRQTYSRVVMGAMVEATYLHTVCLYQEDEHGCQNDDVVWQQRLQFMMEAMEEVSGALSQAEERLKCSRKRVKITHVCNLKQDAIPFFGCGSTSSINTYVRLDSRQYWPQDDVGDCRPYGNFYDSCMVPNSQITGGKCFALKNPVVREYTWSSTLKLLALENCEKAGLTKAQVDVPGHTWYGGRYQCGKRTIEVTDSRRGGKFKLEIEGVPRG